MKLGKKFKAFIIILVIVVTLAGVILLKQELESKQLYKPSYKTRVIYDGYDVKVYLNVFAYWEINVSVSDPAHPAKLYYEIKLSNLQSNIMWEILNYTKARFMSDLGSSKRDYEKFILIVENASGFFGPWQEKVSPEITQWYHKKGIVTISKPGTYVFAFLQVNVAVTSTGSFVLLKIEEWA